MGKSSLNLPRAHLTRVLDAPLLLPPSQPYHQNNKTYQHIPTYLPPATTVPLPHLSNMLSLNPAKTEFLLIGTPQQRQRVLNPIITFEGSQITPSSTSRSLGVLF